MPKISDHPRTEAIQDLSTPKPEQIRDELHAILASPSFHGSKRCQSFLEYVCEKSLSGEASDLKERTIAIEVFGRPAHSDLGEDTIVRVGAREVRKRLAQYYVTGGASASNVRIDLVPGSYAPEFRRVQHERPEPEKPVETLIAPVQEAVPAAHVMPRSVRSLSWRGYLIALAVTLAVAALVWWSRGTPDERLAAKFWQPIYADSEPLILAVSNPIVYHPSARAVALNELSLPPQAIPFQREIQLPANKLDGSDMIPVRNQYVGFGDMVAANEITSMTARKGKATRVRLASGIEFADMRQAQTVLIGAYTNRWTMELGQGWKVQFGRTPDHGAMLFDATSGQQWTTDAKSDGSAPDDYFLICRIRNSSAGGFLLVVAGLKQFGTEAGGLLLTDTSRLGAILRTLPPGWESKNVQIVLHAKIIGNTPAQPGVVATRVW